MILTFKNCVIDILWLRLTFEDFLSCLQVATIRRVQIQMAVQMQSKYKWLLASLSVNSIYREEICLTWFSNVKPGTLGQMESYTTVMSFYGKSHLLHKEKRRILSLGNIGHL